MSAQNPPVPLAGGPEGDGIENQASADKDASRIAKKPSLVHARERRAPPSPRLLRIGRLWLAPRRRRR
jgi:hypothetical protein